MKIAILGASKPHLPLYLKAREMGLETYCIAWSQGAFCKDYADHYCDISITNKEAIVELCKKENIDGIISNALEAAVPTMAYVSEKCNFNGNTYEAANIAVNKKKMRIAVDLHQACPQPQFAVISDDNYLPDNYPIIVKPTDSSCSNGVTKVNNEKEFKRALQRAKEASYSGEILIEEYVEGREISVESISYHGKHYVLTITDKETTGAPFFVEIAHHQPSNLPIEIKAKLYEYVPAILNAIGITNGASHAEFKIDNSGNIKFIEVGARGGGDFISYNLVHLSTGYDYVRGMIEVALGHFNTPNIKEKNCSGVYFLGKETEYLKKYISTHNKKDWVYDFEVQDTPLQPLTKSQDRSGFIIYCSQKRIEINNL